MTLAWRPICWASEGWQATVRNRGQIVRHVPAERFREPGGKCCAYQRVVYAHPICVWTYSGRFILKLSFNLKVKIHWNQWRSSSEQKILSRHIFLSWTPMFIGTKLKALSTNTFTDYLILEGANLSKAENHAFLYRNSGLSIIFSSTQYTLKASI